MSEGKSSTLNPLANSFVPSKMAEMTTMRRVAESLLKKVVEKESKGETFSKKEIANIVGELILLKYKDSPGVDISKVNRYLTEKILSSKTLPEIRPIHDKLICKVDKISFDLSKFEPPETPLLLVSFWGLYRHEQAVRPLLSLPHRPEVVKDKIWSIDSFDKELWNQSCVKDVCQCPPIFGYAIPPACFGNPLKLSYSCSVETIHLNHYPESIEGNEFILTNYFNCNILDEHPFTDDFENTVSIKINLDDLAIAFENIMYGLCDLLTKYCEFLDDCPEDLVSPVEEVECTEETVFNLVSTDENENSSPLWDDCNTESNSCAVISEELDDDEDHPLLEIKNYDPDEGVSKEIEEMIRRSLSPKKVEHQNSLTVEFEDVEPIEIMCNPPCSVWCTNACKDNDPAATDNNTSVPVSTDDIPHINLISPEDLVPEAESEPEIVKIDLKPSLDTESELPKRLFKRSLSVNDCDPYYYCGRFDFQGTIAQATYSSELFKFKSSGKDFGNFQPFIRSNSWKDTDSGFVSYYSSQEDLCDKEYDEKGSMWGLFSGEDSLWKPLPECSTQAKKDEKQVTHKRVRDLRRQRSLN